MIIKIIFDVFELELELVTKQSLPLLQSTQPLMASEQLEQV
jgi:hypothetical protein